MRHIGKYQRDEQGIAFVLVIILTITSVVLVGTYFSTSLAKVRHVQQHEMELSAFNAAESGLNLAVNEAWQVYKNAPPEDRFTPLREYLLSKPIVEKEDLKNLKDLKEIQLENALLDGQTTSTGDETGTEPVLRSFFPVSTVGKSRVCTFVRDMNIVPDMYADVEFVSRGENDEAARTLVQVVRFGSRPSRVFDSAYFINNFGWLWGAGITVNGSVRSNANFSVGNAVVNGDIYASENEDLLAIGTIEGDIRHKDYEWYNRYYGDRARPTDPTAPIEDANGNGYLDPGEDRNGNGKLDDFEYPDGYNCEPERQDRQHKIDMPYIGDLSLYRTAAIAKGASVTQGGHKIIDGVYGDHPDEKKDLVLIGTEDDPIVINGPVVIENDLVIKGYITGQGTFYTGRNVHMVGDVKYVNPPSWPKSTMNIEEVIEQNKSKDLIGFAAKGSIIFGDYSGSQWLSVTKKYQTPPFTQPYAVDPSDESIGYVSYYDDKDRPTFDGDYRDYDGGLRDDEDKTGIIKKISRKYYESSLSDRFISSIADNQITHIDGVLYTNHMVSGKVGSFVLNGCLVSRDEAIIFHGSLDINYDIRTRYGEWEFLDIYLPREPVKTTVLFREGL